MPTLAFDTATEILTVAAGKNGKVLCEKSVDAGRSHLELLLPTVNALLAKIRSSIKAVDFIVVGIGPGTFSGLRVGVSTARALAQTLQIPLAGFSTLEAQALVLADRLAEDERQLLLPLIDAKRGQIFARIYRKEGKGMVSPESEVLCLDPEKLIEKVAGITQARISAGGNGAVAHRSILASSEQIELLPENDAGNRVNARWHLQNAARGVYAPEQAAAIVPVYMREPDADKTILLRKR